ncbi:MAG: PLxRFG domain-containing protein [Minisyncoccota bacterium]
MVDFVPDLPDTSRFILDEAPVQSRFVPDEESILTSGVLKAKLAYQEAGRFLMDQVNEGMERSESVQFANPKLQALATRAPDKAARIAAKDKEIEETKKRIETTEPKYDPENPITSTAKRAASTIVGLVGETPLFMAGGGAVTPVAKAISSGISKVAPKTAKVVEAGLTQAGAFGGESALRGQDVGEVAGQTATGLAFGVAGKVAPKGLKTAAEGLVFIGAEKIKGHDLEAKDYGEILGILLGMKAVGKAYTKTTDVATDIKKAAAISRSREGMSKEKVKAAEEVMTSPEGKAVVEEALRGEEKADGINSRPLNDTTPGANSASDIKGFFQGIGKSISANFYVQAWAALQKGSVKVAGMRDPILVRAKPDFDAGLLKGPEDLVKYVNAPAATQRPLFEGPTVAERLASASKANIDARAMKNKARIRAIRDEHKAAMEAAARDIPLTPEEIAYKQDHTLKPSLREEALVKLQEVFPGTTPMERLTLLRERQKLNPEVRTAPPVAESQAPVTPEPGERSVASTQGGGTPGPIVDRSKALATETLKSWEPISPEWTADPTAEAGRSTHYYGIERGDFSTRKAEVVPTITESNVPAYNARTVDGRDLGTYSTPREAMQAISDAVALPTPKPPGIPPGQRGSIDPEILLPKVVRMGVERVSKDVKSVLDTLKVLKESRENRSKFETEYDLVRFNKFIATTHGLLQVRELNKNLPWLNEYVDAIQAMHQTKSMRLQTANDQLKSWQALGKEMAGKLAKSLLEETVAKRTFKPEELVQYKLSAEALLLRQKIKADFAQFLNDAERLLKQRAAGRLEGPALEAELKGITEDFTDLRSKPYFPLSRWGRELVVVKRGGKTIDVEAFESVSWAEIGKAKMEAKYKGDKSVQVTRSYVPESIFSFQGMPPRVAERMANELLKDPTLSPEQANRARETLSDLMYRLSPEASWRKHLLKRKGTAGFSMDGMRAYASYMLHGSNHLSRIQFADILTESINKGNIAAKDLQARGRDNADYLKLVEWMEKHRQYVMNPKNELAQLRSVAFMWYLGFMPKAAFVNLTQTGLVTLPYLSARYGDVSATVELLRAMKDVPQSLMRNKKVLTKDEVQMMEKLTPILNESFASTVGATAEGGHLARVLPQTSVGRGIADMAGKASYLFQIAEGYNRRVSALAAYRLARKKGLNEDTATKAAQEAVEGTQFEYASWNRPVFMRGKKSILTVFMQYVQNMLFFVGRDPGAKRALVMLTAAAGVQGLPFMEDILDILDKLLSTKNVKFDSRKELREAALELELNPDLIMHGVSRYGFGIPDVDLSGSVSLGRPIRATEPLLRSDARFTGQFSDTAQSVGGAVLSIPIEIWKFAASDKADSWKAAERIMPSIGRSVAQSYRYLNEEVAKINGGKDVPIERIDTAEGAYKGAMTAAGFQLREITTERERVFATRETQHYYAARRKELMGEYEYALNSKQPEAVKDAGKAITQYNREVPFKTYAISIGDLQASLKQKAMRNSLEEAGLLGSKTGADVTIEYAPAFPK